MLLTGHLSAQYVFYPMPDVLAFLLLVLTYRQLFGHTLWGTTWRLAVVVFFVNVFRILLLLLYLAGYIFGTGMSVGASLAK